MTTPIRGKILTDKRIAHYILKGFYGPTARDALVARDRKPAKRKRSTLSKVLATLSNVK